MLKITLEGIACPEIIFFTERADIPRIGEEFELPCDVKAVNISSGQNKFVDSQVFIMLIKLSGNIAINLLSTYIYDKLRKISENKKATLKINDIHTPIDEASINERIFETITINPQQPQDKKE